MMLTQYKMNFSEEIIRSFVAVHEICPKEFSSPYKFLIFIKTYKKLFTQKKEALENRLRKLKVSEIEFIIKKIKNDKNLE